MSRPAITTTARDVGHRAWDGALRIVRDWGTIARARRLAASDLRAGRDLEAIVRLGRLVREVQGSRESLRTYDRIAALLAAGRRGPEGLRLPEGPPDRFVLFVGYSRSGHSLVGSLLDAHPDAVISHELHAASHLARGASVDRVARAMVMNAFFFDYFGRGYSGYSYQVPGQMQGTYRRLRVLGDKKANGTTRLLRRDPALPERLHEILPAPLRWIHVVRNPFDNIATKARRTRTTLGAAADVYFRHVDAVSRLKRSEGDRVIDVFLDDLTRDPHGVMQRLVRELGVDDTPADYFDACAKLLFAEPQKTRGEHEWSDALVREVRGRMADHAFLARFLDEPIPR